MHCKKPPLEWVARSPGATKHMYPMAGWNPIYGPKSAIAWDNDMLDGSHDYRKTNQGSPMQRGVMVPKDQQYTVVLLRTMLMVAMVTIS